MTRPRPLILFIVVLDAMGIGVVFPTMPELLRSLMHAHAGDVARQYGLLLAAYALTMLLASPTLGVLSDRFGRRPVLLFSLAGTCFDDLVLTFAPSLRVLYLGRTLAGLFGANMTVASAYIADITPEDQRAKAFGQMNACFGVGFIAGPILGGLAGMYSLRAPFLAAAVLNAIGGLLCILYLPESRKALTREPIRLQQLNPFMALRTVTRLRGAGRLLFVFCTMEMVGQVPAVLWVIYGTARFHWTPFTVGLSFATFGLLHALCQALLPDRAEKALGERGTVLAGMAVDSVGYAWYSLVSTTVGAFCAFPVMCLGGIGMPAVQSMLSRTVDESRQGELQGVLTSFTSLIAVVGPIFASNLYGVARDRLPIYPGAIWLAPILLYVPCFFFLMRTRAEA